MSGYGSDVKMDVEKYRNKVDWIYWIWSIDHWRAAVDTEMSLRIA
jgi:hypothetical protein